MAKYLRLGGLQENTFVYHSTKGWEVKVKGSSYLSNQLEPTPHLSHGLLLSQVSSYIGQAGLSLDSLIRA